MKCLSCANEIESTANFCPRCGARQQCTKETGIPCRGTFANGNYCQGIVRASDTFCCTCGTEVNTNWFIATVLNQKVCLSCKSVLVDHSKFCLKCGKPVKTVPAAETGQSDGGGRNNEDIGTSVDRSYTAQDTDTACRLKYSEVLGCSSSVDGTQYQPRVFGPFAPKVQTNRQAEENSSVTGKTSLFTLSKCNSSLENDKNALASANTNQSRNQEICTSEKVDETINVEMKIVTDSTVNTSECQSTQGETRSRGLKSTRSATTSDTVVGDATHPKNNKLEQNQNSGANKTGGHTNASKKKKRENGEADEKEGTAGGHANSRFSF